jgi:RNA-binding protein
MAMSLEPIFHIGKSGLTPEITTAVSESLEKRELVKLDILKNCDEDLVDVANRLAERTRSDVVQTIGRKIVLYRPAKDEQKRKIQLPRPKRSNAT